MIRYRKKDCYSCSTTDRCVPVTVLVGDLLPTMKINVVNAPGGPPADLTDYTATARVFFRTVLAANLEEDGTSIKVLCDENGETWPEVDDVILIDGPNQEQVVVTDTLPLDDGDYMVSKLQIARDNNQGKFWAGTPIKVIRGDCPVSLTATLTQGTDINGPYEQLLKTEAQVSWTPEVTAYPGRFYVTITLTEPETGRTITLPRSGEGYPLLVVS